MRISQYGGVVCRAASHFDFPHAIRLGLEGNHLVAQFQQHFRYLRQHQKTARRFREESAYRISYRSYKRPTQIYLDAGTDFWQADSAGHNSEGAISYAITRVSGIRRSSPCNLLRFG